MLIINKISAFCFAEFKLTAWLMIPQRENKSNHDEDSIFIPWGRVKSRSTDIITQLWMQDNTIANGRHLIARAWYGGQRWKWVWGLQKSAPNLSNNGLPTKQNIIKTLLHHDIMFVWMKDNTISSLFGMNGRHLITAELDMGAKGSAGFAEKICPKSPQQWLAHQAKHCQKHPSLHRYGTSIPPTAIIDNCYISHHNCCLCMPIRLSLKHFRTTP